jgi:putative hydrolase of the HAD superfamily
MNLALNIFSTPLTKSMKETTYKVILFDLFHTLVDVGSVPESYGRYTADILGVGRDEWNQACFGAAHDICRPTDHVAVIRALAHSIDPSVSDDLIVEAAEERLQRFEHALLHVEPEVTEALTQLRDAGLRLGLLSNASTGEVQAWPRSPLAPLFDEAFFSCECGCAKPDAAFYQHAISTLGVAREECLFVGDGGSREHEGAERLGIDNVLITRHIAHYDEGRLAPRRAAARWEITQLSELWSIVWRGR